MNNRDRIVGAALALATALAASPSAAFDRAAWLADFDQLKSALERSYANLAWMASPQSGIDAPALDRRTRAAIEAAQGDDDAPYARRGHDEIGACADDMDRQVLFLPDGDCRCELLRARRHE